MANGSLAKSLLQAVAVQVAAELERQHYEKALLESKARAETLFGAITDAIFVHEVSEDGRVGKFLEVNDVACRHLGYTREELLQLAPVDIDAPDANVDLEPLVRKLFAGESITFEQVHMHKDGRRIPVEIHARLFELKGRAAVISLVRDISDRGEAEEARRRFEHIVSTSTDILALLDRNFVYLAVNPAYLAAWKKSRDEMVGRQAVEVVGEEFFETWMKPNALRCLEGQTVNFQAWYKYPAYEPRYMDFNYYPYTDAKGEVIGFAINGRNMTERHQAEQELQRTMHSLGERMKELHCLYGLSRLAESESGQLTEFMQKAVELLPPGWQYPEITCARIMFEGQEFRTENFACSKWCLARPIVVGGKKRGEVQVCYLEELPETVEGPFLAEEELIEAIAGQLGRTIQQKRSDHELRKKEDELNTIFHYAPVIAFYKDRQGRFLRINRLLAERLGTSEEAPIGKNAFDLYSPEIAASMAQDDNEVMTSGRSKLGIVEEVETVFGRRWVQTDKIPTFGPDGEVTGLVGFATDITERREAEEQLRQAQKLEAIGTLVGGIAHDFNNMLAAIKGNVYLAKLQQKKKVPIEERLDNIEQAATGAAEMVRQLLAFARKEITATTVFSFNSFLKESEKMVRTLVPENIECEIDICHEELTVRGDMNQLKQALLNLFNNARDAIAEASNPRIVCSLAPFRADEAFRRRHPALKQDAFACWSVADNGCGIPEEQLERIFEPFFTTKEVDKGTGLGLAMVFGTIKNHGGVIEVASTEGEGTVFRIYLPISAEAVTEAGESRPVRVKGKGETILLADDEDSVRSSTRSVLESLGYKVLEAVDGEAALKVFMDRREKIDLLMTDVVMPKLNGTDLLLQVRQSRGDLPAILVTGYDRGKMLGEHLELERCEAINKPFNFDELSVLLRRLLDTA